MASNLSKYYFLNHGSLLVCLFFFMNLFIYLLAALVLRCCRWAFSSCSERGATLHCGARASHCGGFSCCGARALGTWASVVVAHGLQRAGSVAVAHRLSSCGTWAQLLCGMWNLPRPGFEPVSPALAGGFLTAAPPRKPTYDPFNALLNLFS